jgi:hypothetical protein
MEASSGIEAFATVAGLSVLAALVSASPGAVSSPDFTAPIAINCVHCNLTLSERSVVQDVWSALPECQQKQLRLTKVDGALVLFLMPSQAHTDPRVLGSANAVLHLASREVATVNFVPTPYWQPIDCLVLYDFHRYHLSSKWLAAKENRPPFCP